MKITRMTLLALSDAMQRGDLTSREVTQAYLDRIHQVEGKVQAYISLNEDEALRQADECDKKRQQGEKVSPLCGIPVAVKDNICVKGGKTTCASKMLADFVSPYSATVWEKLQAAAASCSARRIWMSSPWARPPKTARFTPRITRVICRACRAVVRRLGSVRRGRMKPRSLSGSDTAAPFASPRRSAALSA